VNHWKLFISKFLNLFRSKINDSNFEIEYFERLISSDMNKILILHLKEFSETALNTFYYYLADQTGRWWNTPFLD
jgi:hypothetical protein